MGRGMKNWEAEGKKLCKWEEERKMRDDGRTCTGCWDGMGEMGEEGGISSGQNVTLELEEGGGNGASGRKSGTEMMGGLEVEVEGVIRRPDRWGEGGG